MRSTRAKAKLAAAALSAVVLFGVSGTVPLTSTAAGASGAKAGGCASSARRAAEPSGQAPPPAHAMVGYVLSYCTDFNGTALPRGWGKFIGVPSGDPYYYSSVTRLCDNESPAALVDQDCARPPTFLAPAQRMRTHKIGRAHV